MSLLGFAGLGDSHSTKYVFRVGIIIFTAASFACALAHSLPLLIAARAVQGVGAAALMSVGPALYRQIFPSNELGKALGISSVIVATSAAAGPTIGGSILHIAPWPWLFAINVPLGIFDIFFAAYALPQIAGRGHHLDRPSLVLSALAFGATIYGIDGFARHESPWLIALEIALGVAAGIAFVRRQNALPQPMLAIDLFTKPVFALATATALGTYVAQGLAYVSLPFFFQSALGRSPFESGLLLTSWPVAVAIIAPLAGKLSDKYHAGILSTIGLAIMAAGLALYALLPAHPSSLEIVLHGIICGVGFGFFQSPNNRELMGTAPRAKIGSAAGILASVRLSGQTTGAALVAIVFGFAGASALGRAVPETLWIACGFAAAGAIASSLRLFVRRGQPAAVTTG
jgi:DHA2 family multidrug resistance protein-like MFS transporter